MGTKIKTLSRKLKMKEQISALATLISTLVLPATQLAGPLLSPIPKIQEIALAEQSLDLTTREPNAYANQVFANNILLALHYLKEDIDSPKIDWYWVRKPFEVSFTLQPDEVFAFHANVLPEFTEPVKTMNSRFFIEEGYKSVGGLGGNGVCHLASLINWVASEVRLDSPSSVRRVGLEVTAPANHNFAPVPGVPEEYGTSIRSQSKNQNLYIRNDSGSSVKFIFTIKGQMVNLRIVTPV